MQIDVNNIVRTVVGGAAILSITLPVGNLSRAVAESVDRANTDSKAALAYADVKDELTRTCIDYFFSKGDSKLERQAKNQLDEYFDGEVDYRAVCNYVVN